MTISKHIHSLQQHLAQLGLYPAQTDTTGQPEVFKVCFLNKYEMERWQELREREKDQERTLPSGDDIKD